AARASISRLTRWFARPARRSTRRRRACTGSSAASCCGRGTSRRSAVSCRRTPLDDWQRLTDALEAPRSPFLALPGAVEGEGPDAGTPAHYGAFLAEQRPLS